MQGKKRDFFRTVIAFALGVGVTLAVQGGVPRSQPSPYHVQSFAGTAPAGGVTTASTATTTTATATATTVAATTAATTAPAPAAAVTAPTGSNLTTEQITNQVGPAVVTIINQQKFSGSARVSQIPGLPGLPGGNRYPGAGNSGPSSPGAATTGTAIDAGLGSGVIYDAQGYIITNNHVIDGASAIDVVLADGSRIDATLVGRDPSIDVAVVKIDPAKVPAVATLGNSDNVKPGQRVVAIGSPEALENTVTEGIVSGTNRTIQADATTMYVGLIQTDAAINHGNSGGPLLDAQGTVVGINTLGIRDEQAEGLNFAIPINRVKTATQTIVAKGGGSVVVTRAYLGVTTVTLDKAKAQQYNTKVTDGAYVDSVDPGSPAEKAGVKKGDVIVAVNGTSLNARVALGDLLNNAKPGDAATLTINRNGTAVTVTAMLVTRPVS